ncbi:MAG: phosphoribosylformylglycinamidine synthase subunit PurS [Anaerolineae bacterium]
MSRSIACLIVSSRVIPDPRAAGLLADAHALGLHNLVRLECHDLYFIEAETSRVDLEPLAVRLLVDPISQQYRWREPGDAQPAQQVIETALRPGVTDRVATEIVRAARLLGIQGVERAATGQRFVLHGACPLSNQELETLARRLFANPVIQRYALGEIEPSLPHDAAPSDRVDIIPLRELNAEQLLTLSVERRAALDLAEMSAIQKYFEREGRDPTDIEFEMIAQTWSEHCIHKTFRAQIDVAASAAWPAQAERINGLLRTFIRAATEQIAAPWVRSAFVDNAGIIDFDEEFEISFKVETHNHPSAIEPFGGANTGIGGVIRDILGVSAKPIAATDVLCFGPQDLALEQLTEGVLHPRRIRSGVVAGIQDYGNKIGIPTVNGAILYDPGYTANPLVFCGCVGMAPKGKHPRQPQPGDRIIVLGGRTGRDGLRGATFSSMTMDAQTGEVAGASVQIGDPITEKGLVEVIVRARDQGLYHAITDCGAGGLSSAVGEMARECGAAVDMGQVRLKYSGLSPWEIWLSEAQERMVLAVPEVHLPALQALCDDYDVELTDIGAFAASGRICVRYGERTVLDLDAEFLHEGIPQRHLTAILPQKGFGLVGKADGRTDASAVLLDLLAHPNIASKADIIRVYDHEVQGGTIIKPLTGVMNDGPSDACVIKPLGTRGTRGIALACGINAEFGKYDPYHMAVSVVDEAIRNLVAVGANPERIALLDNFCWGNPLNPETLGTLVEAARGCYDAALYYGTPFISGKDSLNNEYLGADGLRHAIPPTLLISAIGLVEDINRAVTMDLKEPGNLIYLLGARRLEMSGAHINLIDPPLCSQEFVEQVKLEADWQDGEHTATVAGTESISAGGGGWKRTPGLPSGALQRYRALHQAMCTGLVRACHDVSEGGVAVAIAEMCIAGRLGATLQLETNAEASLFSEANGSLLVEVRPNDAPAFEKHFERDQEFWRVGVVTDTGRLLSSVTNPSAHGISLPVDDLVRAWSERVSL